MQKILQQLNQEVGVKGSMVITSDGLVVISELSEELDEEIVAAMASSTIKYTKQSLKLLGTEKFDRLILTATYGRIVFIDIELACLLVVTDKKINIDFTLLEIDGAAQRLKKTWKM